jgi:hypothetical protein
MTDTDTDEYIVALDKYYNLKNTYKQSIKKGLKETGPGFKPKCINCERQVGTFFYTSYNPEVDGRNLIAICGDKQTPCALKIDINVGYCNSLQEDLKEVETLIRNIKNDIIYDKNNAMFGYILKDKALKNFEIFKSSISEYTDRLKTNIEQYDFIINNKNIKNEILKLEFEVNVDIEQIKSLINTSNNTNNTQFVIDAVELYQHTLKPKLDNLMNLKYKYNFLEFNETDKTYQLFQLPHSIETFERCYGNPRIISFKYKPGLQKPKQKEIKEKKPKSQIKTQSLTQTMKNKPEKVKRVKTLKIKPTPFVEQNTVGFSEAPISVIGDVELDTDMLRETEHTNIDF